MSDIILKADNLKKIYKDANREFVAVDNVSFSLKKGHCLGIVGESGSGKSTIAKMITGITPITEGKVFFQDKDITHLKGEEQRELYKDIQMIFQMPMESFDPKHTLGYGIGESLRNIHKKPDFIRERMEKLLLQCGLSVDFADRYPYEVSGGQCQRAAVARALMIEPGLLICDEPTSALDGTIQRQILKLLMKMKFMHDLSMIIICHDLAIVQLCCDDILVVHNGKAVEYGPADLVIANPKNEYTKLLLDSTKF